MSITKSTEVVCLLEQQLGVRCDYSNWWIARELLRVQWGRKPAVIADTSFDLRELPFTAAARDVLWRRELQPYMVGWHVHHYDKNSHYLAAGRGVTTGIGDPVHIAQGDDDTFIVPGLPGIYRISNVSSVHTIFGDVGLPPIIEPGQEWITNDVLLFAREHEYTFHIEEAWVFPDYTKVLDKWSEKLWKARVALRDTPAYPEVKDIAVKGNGSWATSKEKMFDRDSLDLIHPNWWADVKGKGRVNILANLLKYGPPVLIKTDGLWYVTRDSNYRTAVPGILDRMNECGGYKHESSFKLTREIFEQARGLSKNELSTLFKRAGGEEVRHDDE